jgi:hypothetical protein
MDWTIWGGFTLFYAALIGGVVVWMRRKVSRIKEKDSKEMPSTKPPSSELSIVVASTNGKMHDSEPKIAHL